MCGGPDAGKTDAGTADAGSPGNDGGASTGDAFPASSTIYQDISGAALDTNSSAEDRHRARQRRRLGHEREFPNRLRPRHPPRQLYRGAPGVHPGQWLLHARLRHDGGSPAAGRKRRRLDRLHLRCRQRNNCHVLVYQGQRLYELYQATTDNGQASGGR